MRLGFLSMGSIISLLYKKRTGKLMKGSRTSVRGKSYFSIQFGWLSYLKGII